MLHYDWFYITDAESILKLTKIINGIIVESMLHYVWFYITDAESALKLTRIIFGNMVWSMLQCDVD